MHQDKKNNKKIIETLYKIRDKAETVTEKDINILLC